MLSRQPVAEVSERTVPTVLRASEIPAQDVASAPSKPDVAISDLDPTSAGQKHRIARPSGLVPIVVDELVPRIVSGELSGRSFPAEAEFIAEYGVSRTVVREALRVLEAKGLVSIQQGRSTTGLTADHWDLLDPQIIAALVRTDPGLDVVAQLVDVRAALESEMTRLAASKIDDPVREELNEAWEALTRNREDFHRYLDLDRSFHDVFMRASGNMFGRHIVREVFEWTRLGPDRLIEDSDIRDSHADHTRIRDLALAGRADEAGEAMRAHILDRWHAKRQRILDSRKDTV